MFLPSLTFTLYKNTKNLLKILITTILAIAGVLHGGGNFKTLGSIIKAVGLPCSNELMSPLAGAEISNLLVPSENAGDNWEKGIYGFGSKTPAETDSGNSEKNVQTKKFIELEDSDNDPNLLRLYLTANQKEEYGITHDVIKISLNDVNGTLTIDKNLKERIEELMRLELDLKTILRILFPGAEYDQVWYKTTKIPMLLSIGEALLSRTQDETHINLTLVSIFPLEFYPEHIAIIEILFNGEQIEFLIDPLHEEAQGMIFGREGFDLNALLYSIGTIEPETSYSKLTDNFRRVHLIPGEVDSLRVIAECRIQVMDVNKIRFHLDDDYKSHRLPDSKGKITAIAVYNNLACARVYEYLLKETEGALFTTISR